MGLKPIIAKCVQLPKGGVAVVLNFPDPEDDASDKNIVTNDTIWNGVRNTVIGFGQTVTGDENVIVGGATRSLTGDQNTFFGYSAGSLCATGSQNVFLGAYAGGFTNQKTDAVNSIAIGYRAVTTANNQVVIGNSSIVETVLNGRVVAPWFSPTVVPTTVGGSTSGSADFVMPMRGDAYKKVVIYCNGILGTASYTFPTAFTHTPDVLGENAGLVSAISTTAVTVTGVASYGFILIYGW